MVALHHFPPPSPTLFPPFSCTLTTVQHLYHILPYIIHWHHFLSHHPLPFSRPLPVPWLQFNISIIYCPTSFTGTTFSPTIPYPLPALSLYADYSSKSLSYIALWHYWNRCVSHRPLPSPLPAFSRIVTAQHVSLMVSARCRSRVSTLFTWITFFCFPIAISNNSLSFIPLPTPTAMVLTPCFWKRNKRPYKDMTAIN